MEAVRDPKNVILLFDISYTMKDNNKKDFMRSALIQGLKGLLRTDFANVVAFAGSALVPGMLHGGETDGTYSSCFKTQLVQATWQNLLQLKRFVGDIPLASEKVSNYYKAVVQALKLITNASMKRDTHLIIVAGSPDSSSGDILRLITEANATLSVYSLLDENSKKKKEKATIAMLKELSIKSNGVFESITDYKKLAFRMGRFYKKLADQQTREMTFSSPYFNERLGMFVTLGAPCYSEKKKLIGVVGIDITLSELLKNTVTFGPGELSYTFVIATNSGQALVHPHLPQPESIEENPVFIEISSLETATGVSDVLHSMMKRKTGTKVVTSERVLSRGDPSFNGYRGVKTTFTYAWKPINNTRFAVCVVVADKELNTKEIETPKPYKEPDLYHRYDLLKYLKEGSIIEDKPIAFLMNASFPATLSRSNYYLSPSCFEDPYKFENTPETVDFVKRLSDYVNGASQIAPDPALKTDVLTDIRLTRAIETCWNRNPMKLLGSDAAWRYIVTNAGAMRQYPGRQTYNNRYDPTTRPWYYAAKSYPGKTTFSVPYLDNGESGVVVTTSQTISSDSMVRAVMGIDWKMKKIHELVVNSGALCSQNSVVCMLIDPNGYVVYIKQFVSRPRMAKDRVHLAYKHPELLLDLMKKRIISTSLACNNLEVGETYINYKITDEIPNNIVEGTISCGNYIMVPVDNTNVYLVAIDGGDCPSSKIRCTSCSKKSCADGITKDSSASSPICIPCHCGVAYNPCTMHYYQSPNAAVTCPYMTRLKIKNDKIVCKMPDTDSNPLAVATKNPPEGAAGSKEDGHTRSHATTSASALHCFVNSVVGVFIYYNLQ